MEILALCKALATCNVLVPNASPIWSQFDDGQLKSVITLIRSKNPQSNRPRIPHPQSPLKAPWTWGGMVMLQNRVWGGAPIKPRRTPVPLFLRTPKPQLRINGRSSRSLGTRTKTCSRQSKREKTSRLARLWRYNSGAVLYQADYN